MEEGGGTFTVQTFSLWRVWPRALPLDSGESRNNLCPCAGRTRRGKWGGTGQCNAGELEARPKLATNPNATFLCQHYGVVNSRFGTAKMGGDVVEVDWRIHPESASGTCLHSNRSFWLVPAHQGMKIGCIG